MQAFFEPHWLSSSGTSRGGAWGSHPQLFWVKKNEERRRKKSRQDKHPPPLPPPGSATE